MSLDPKNSHLPGCLPFAWIVEPVVRLGLIVCYCVLSTALMKNEGVIE